MQLPEELQVALDRMLEGSSSSLLKKAREVLTATYHQGGDSSSIFKDPAQRLTYLATRMPATYAAVRKVLAEVPFPCTHFLDLGAGPGTASWAAREVFPELTQITCVERSLEAIELGKQLGLQGASWLRHSLTEPFPVPVAEVAVLSYVLNELTRPEDVVKRIWEGPVACLVLIEPGTPKGFQTIRALRQQLIDLGAHLIAPCPHAFVCPIQGNDWCHFSARIERTRMHRLLKGGSLGHEDEKFSYIIASKKPAPAFLGRVVRPPQKGSGHVRLALCTDQGALQEKVITRKDKELYRQARDTDWGDRWM